MLRILFFFFIAFFIISSQQKLDSKLSHQNSHPSVEIRSSSILQRVFLNDDANVRETDIETYQVLLNDVDSSFFDYISTDDSILKSDSNDLQNYQLLYAKSAEDLDEDIETDLVFFFQSTLESFYGWSSRMLQLQTEITHILEESVNQEFILENEMQEETLLETGEIETHVINESEIVENNENNEGSSDEGEICIEGETTLESQEQRLLGAYISIHINIHINIETGENQEENVEEQYSTPPIVVPNINPGNQECQQITICRYTIIPRVGKKCLCKQELSCS